MPDALSDPSPTPASKWQSNRAIRVLVRALRTWLQTFVGLVIAGVGGAAGASVGGIAYIPPDSAGQMLATAAYIALFPSGIALLQNAAEELGKFDPGITLRG